MVGPLRGDETLAAIAQHDQQLQSAVSAKMADHHQRLPFQRMPKTRNRHGRGHRLITAAAERSSRPVVSRVIVGAFDHPPSRLNEEPAASLRAGHDVDSDSGLGSRWRGLVVGGSWDAHR